MRSHPAPLIVLALAFAASPAVRADLPVKEVTIFKDGHALVLRQGSLPTDAAGDVALGDLPSPVLGTFWPYSARKDAGLASVVASTETFPVRKPAAGLRELIALNPGASVQITEQNGTTYAATLVASPDADASPPSPLLLLHTDHGDKALPFEQIKDVTFKAPYKTSAPATELRNQLTLHLDWRGRPPAATAEVGMMYVEHGLLWIPSYKVDLDGTGKANVKLQATLVNDLIDLNDVTAQMVIGVPSFAAQGMTDPISLQQTMAQIAAALPANSYSGNAFSNAMSTQVAVYGVSGATPASPNAPAAGEGREDLFVYSLKHVTLKKGQRMVVPLAEWTLEYRDVYTLDLPFSPPSEVLSSLGYPQQEEIARQLAQPHVEHLIRLCNTTAAPLTTAPVLILRGGQVLSQGLMRYTPSGGNGDLEVGTALGIKVKKADREVKRIPNAETWNKDAFSKILMEGSVTLTNFGARPADLEIHRETLGRIEATDHAGTIDKLDPFEDDTGDFHFPSWWNSYSWQNWQSHFMTFSRANWKLTLPAGDSKTLGYTWSYYWL